LSKDGWRPAQQLDWGNALKLLSASLPLSQLPVLPQVHDGRHEGLMLVKDLSEDSRLVLRLWRTAVRLQPGGRPLWVGSLGVLERRVLMGFLNYPSASAPLTEPGARLQALSVLRPRPSEPPAGGLLRILDPESGAH